MRDSRDYGNLQKRAGVPAVAVVGGGCAATATQVIVLRECLALFYGSELTVGLVFFFWLFWTGVGSVVGGRLGPSLFPAPPARFRFVLVLVVIYGLLLPLTVLWVRASRSLFGVGPGELATFQCTVTVIAAVTAPVCGFFGVFFGSAWSVYAALTASLQGTFRLYALEALGSAFGGIWLYFFLVPRRPLLYGAACLGAALAAFGVWALAAQGASIRRARHGIVAFMTVCMVLATGFLEEASRRWQWGPEVVAVVDTPYRNTAVLRHESQWTLMADGLWLFSYPDPQSAEDDVHLAMLQHPQPQRILVLGPLSPETLKEILRYPKIQSVDVVDPDKTLAFFAAMVRDPGTAPFREDPRVFHWDQDIRRFVEKARSSYDVVLLNAGDPFSLSTNRFYTQEFYRSVARLLGPGGIFSVGVSGAEDMLGDTQAAYFRGVVGTLRSVFPHYLVYPGERIRLAASMDANALNEDPKTLSERAVALGLPLRYVRPDRLQNLLDPFRLAYFRALAERNERDGINRDLNPLGFIAASRLWAAQFHSGVDAFLRPSDRAAGALWTPMAVSIFMFFLLWAAATLFKPRAGVAVAGAVGTMGAAQMAFQVLVLFLYQIVAGALYAHVTVLVSIYMAGLSAGAFAVHWLLRVKRTVLDERRGFLGVHATATLLVLGVFPLSAADGMESLRLWPPWAVLGVFGGLGLLAGTAGGAHFALGCLVGERAGLRRGAVGSMLYGTDLLGAAAAAVATPLILVPLFGVPRVFLVYGILLSLVWITTWLTLRKV